MQVTPDEQCFAAVLHTLAHAGLAVETAQELGHMLQSGMQPSAGLLTDVLSLATLTFTRANLQALVQVSASTHYCPACSGGCGSADPHQCKALPPGKACNIRVETENHSCRPWGPWEAVG